MSGDCGDHLGRRLRRDRRRLGRGRCGGRGVRAVNLLDLDAEQRVGRQRLELARVVLLLEVPAALDRVLALLARHAQAELEVELHLGRVPDAAATERAVVEARLVGLVARDLELARSEIERGGDLGGELGLLLVPEVGDVAAEVQVKVASGPARARLRRDGRHDRRAGGRLDRRLRRLIGRHDARDRRLRDGRCRAAWG